MYHFLQKYEEAGGTSREFWQGRIEALVLEFGKPEELEVLGSLRGLTHWQQLC